MSAHQTDSEKYPSTVAHRFALGSHNITFSDSARNLGVILDSSKLVFYAQSTGAVISRRLDSNLSTKKHLMKICKTAYSELEHISSIRTFLTEYAAKTLVVSSYILSRPAVNLVCNAIHTYN